LKTGETPNEWNLSKTTLLSKLGKPTPDNFRPIALIPTVSKIFTILLNSRITEYLEGNTLLSYSQQGFRRNRSTHLNVYVVLEQITLAKRSNTEIHISFLDLKKAYDSI